MMALVLAEHANEANIDILKVIKMVLIHDIPEIDVGDAFLYDESSRAAVMEKERQAATRIFGMLPEDMAAEFMALWEEFEEKETPEARFAGALDRLEPLLQNYHTNGHAWQKHGIVRSQVENINSRIQHGSETLWDLAQALIAESVASGNLENT